MLTLSRKNVRYLVVIPLLAVITAALINKGGNDEEKRTTEVAIGRGELVVSSVHEGTVSSRRIESVMSRLGGTATIVEVVPEGSSVTNGEVLVRFDSTDVKRGLVKLERNLSVARAQLAGLQEATHPLALRDLEIKRMGAEEELGAEEQYLADSRLLAKEGFVSEMEIERQELKTQRARSKLESIDMKLELTRKHLQPAEVESAKADLASAEQELALARQQLENCTVRAPVDGIVVYQPLHMGSEFRAIRVGDRVYQNQVFMVIPDMEALSVECSLTESDLAKVQKGMQVLVSFVAYPDIRLEGEVQLASAMGRQVPGKPSWQKYFAASVSLNQSDPRIRIGMSAHVHVLTYQNPDAVLVPRNAVFWEQGAAFCRVVKRGGHEIRPLELGMAGTSHYEVLSGLAEKERVMVH